MIRIHRGSIGGSQRSFLQLARRLADEGEEVEFAGENGDWVQGGRFGGFPFHEVPYHPFRAPAAVSAWRLYLLLRKGRFDLVHATGAYLALEAALPAAVAGVPVVLTLPGGRLPILPTWKGHGVICFSAELRDALLRKRGRDPGRILLIGNRIDCAATEAAARTPDPAVPGGSETRYRITMTSRILPGKTGAVRHVLAALRWLRARRKDFEFFLIGDGEELSALRGEADRIHAETGGAFLHFLGKRENPLPLVRSADVVLGVGLSALEGMVLGKPTLIVGETGFAGAIGAERIRDLEYFNFSGRNVKNPVSPEPLAVELDLLLSDPGRRRATGEWGRDYVLRHLDLRSVVSEYVRFYQAAVARRSARVRQTAGAILYAGSALLRALLSRSGGGEEAVPSGPA